MISHLSSMLHNRKQIHWPFFALQPHCQSLHCPHLTKKKKKQFSCITHAFAITLGIPLCSCELPLLNALASPTSPDIDTEMEESREIIIRVHTWIKKCQQLLRVCHLFCSYPARRHTFWFAWRICRVDWRREMERINNQEKVHTK